MSDARPVPPFLVLAHGAQVALLVIANRWFEAEVEEGTDTYLITENVYRFSGFDSVAEAERTGQRIAEFSEAESPYSVTYQVIESREGEIWAWVGTDREHTSRGEGALTHGALGRIIPCPTGTSGILEYRVSASNTDPDEQILRDCLLVIPRPADRSIEALQAEMVTRLEGALADRAYLASAIFRPTHPQYDQSVLLTSDGRIYRLPALPPMPND